MLQKRSVWRGAAAFARPASWRMISRRKAERTRAAASVHIFFAFNVAQVVRPEVSLRPPQTLPRHESPLTSHNFSLADYQPPLTIPALSSARSSVRTSPAMLPFNASQFAVPNHLSPHHLRSSATLGGHNSLETRASRFQSSPKPPKTPFLIAVWKIRTILQPIENNHHRPSLIAEILPPISACSRTAAGPAPPRPIPDHPTPPGAAFFAVLPAESVRSRARQRPAQVEARGAKEDN